MIDYFYFNPFISSVDLIQRFAYLFSQIFPGVSPCDLKNQVAAD